MKKKCLTIIFIALIVVLIILLFIDPPKNKVKAKCQLKSFTITDIGTEIEVEIYNNSKEQVYINKIYLDLYSGNKKITTIQEKIDGKLKTNNNILIKINKKERYPTVEKKLLN